MAAYIGFQPSDYYSTKLYTGTGSSNAITGVGFQPDFTWIKNRDAGDSNVWTDAVRGVTKQVFSNQNSAESTQATNITSFDSGGFTLGTENQVNTNTEDFASWNWKGGTTSGITTDGSTTITPSSYSFSATAGVAILKYTGNGTSGAKVAHGLGAVPKFMCIKNLSEIQDWRVYHVGTSPTVPWEKNMVLNSTAAVADSTAMWNDTAPDSVNFTLGDNHGCNKSGDTLIGYVFADVKGYSKFGSYTGNGNADGAFIYTGFRPAFILLKNSNAAINWVVMDDKRQGFNPNTSELYPSATSAECDTGCYRVDLLSNGFKMRNSSPTINDGSYVYAAFAEFPFVSSNSKAGTAR